jgi:hypothetical protein
MTNWLLKAHVAAGHSLNSLREIDGSCVPAANQNCDALASRRAVALREKGGEGCRPSRLGDNAENTPQGGLRLPDFVVGHQHDFRLNMSLYDRERQIADALGCKTICRNSPRRRIDRLACRECSLQGRSTIRFDRHDPRPATKP